MATFIRRSSRPLCQCQRHFSTSSPRSVSLQWDKNHPEALKEAVPPYPYGPTRWYKQSRLGLYGGQRIQFGNNVSEEFETKTRRKWHPNIFTRKLFSRALNRNVQVRVSARVLRTIDKLGGLDEYLLGEKEARLKELGESGWWLRWAIMQTPAIKNKFAEERRRLGMPQAVGEVEDVTEVAAAVEAYESLQLEETTEKVAMDDAFQIEQTEDLPPLKFRVGPGQHVVLTPNGWRRTRPAESYFSDKQKDKMVKIAYPAYVEKAMQAFREELERRQQRAIEKGKIPLTESECQTLAKWARRKLNKDLKVKVSELYEKRLEAKNARKAVRKEDKLVKLERKDAEGIFAGVDAPTIS